MQGFYNVPADIWEQVVLMLDHRSLKAAALISRNVYPYANRVLYRKLEVSFCKCSQTYLDALVWTITHRPDLAALTKELLVDMSVQWQVKPVESSRWRLYTSGSSRLPRNSGATWNREAVRVLQRSHLEQIMPYLKSVCSIKIILGRIDEDPKYFGFLRFAPREALQTLQEITLRDIVVSPIPSESIGLLSSLRKIDLAYTSFGAPDLLRMLSANANTLEDLTMRHIGNFAPFPFFGGAVPNISLRRLRSLNIRGIQPIDAQGLISILDGCPELRDLRVDILKLQSAIGWSQALRNLADAKFPIRNLKHIKVDAPMGCAEFWESFCAFLLRSGEVIESLYISANAAERLMAPFPFCLRRCLLSEMPHQPFLRRLVIVWPDGVGLDTRSVYDLSQTFPHLNLLHIYHRFPAMDHVTNLLSMITPFKDLEEVHLIFPVHVDGLLQNEDFVDVDTQQAVTKALKDNLSRKSDALIRAFSSDTNVSRFSWCLYEYSRNRSPILYVEISEDKSIQYLSEEVQRYDEHYQGPMDHTCVVGDKTVRLTRKPGWRDEMGNPFLDRKDVCPHAEFIRS